MTQVRQPVGLVLPDFTPEYTLFWDWETYYDQAYSLSKISTEAYVRSDLFEPIGVAVFDGEDAVWFEDVDFRAWAKDIPWERCAVGAHNQAFDALIAAHHYGIVPGFYFDTLSMARALHGPGGISLEKLMPRYGLGEKGHEVVAAKGKHRKDFTQEEWLQYGTYSMNDCLGCAGLFEAMSRQFPESELHLIDATIRMGVLPEFVLDEPMLGQYLLDERKRKADMLSRLSDDPKELRSVLMSNLKFARLLEQFGVDPPRKISPVTKKETWAFAKSDPGMQDLLEHNSDLIRWVAEARVATKSTLNETRTERFLNLGKDGRPMPVFLRYYGAHTGRFSGGDGTNWQNLERTDKTKPERGALRRAVLAPPGKMIVVADSAQIEARVTAWLAGHEVLLEMFRSGEDIYSTFASIIYNRPVDRKKNPEDFLAGFISKCSVLGLGFSMSWRTFAATLLRGMLGGPPVQFTMMDADNLRVEPGKFTEGGWGERRLKQIEKMPSRISLEERIIHCAVADQIVKTWRTANAPTVDLWRTLDGAIETMERANPGESFTFGPGEVLSVERHAALLPNGMKLLYPGLEYRGSEETDEEWGRYSYLGSHKQRRTLYGGKFCENLVQALARIIVTDQMLSMQAYGIRAATMTHDELVYVVDEAIAPQVLQLLLMTMKTSPAWAPGLPLSAEGGIGKRYGECK